MSKQVGQRVHELRGALSSFRTYSCVYASLTAIFILLSIFLTILGEHQQYVRDEQAAVKAAGTCTPEYGVFSYLFAAVQSEAQNCLDLIKAKVRPDKFGQNGLANPRASGVDSRGRCRSTSLSEESFKRRATTHDSFKCLVQVLTAPSGGKATPSGRRPSQRERRLSLASASSSCSEQAGIALPEIGNAGLSVLLANQQVLLKQMLSEQREIKAEQKEIKAELVTARAAPTIDWGTGMRRHKRDARRSHTKSPHRGASTDVALLSRLEVNDALAFRRARSRHRSESEPGSPTKYRHWSMDGNDPPSPPASVCSSTASKRKRRHRKHKGIDAAARTAAGSAAGSAAESAASKAKSMFIV